MGIILFSGVHGVGKGYFLKQKKELIGEYNIYTASEMIAKYKIADDVGYKKVKDIDDNQKVLIKALKIESQNTDKKIILDGHLCLLNLYGDVERIAENFLLDCNIIGIIFLQDEPQIICERLKKRDAMLIEQEKIEDLQNEEKIYANKLFMKYGIKYKVITHGCPEILFEQILDEIGG